MSFIGKLAEAVLVLSVDGAKFDKELSDAEQAAQRRSKSMQSILGGVARVGAVAFAASAAAVIGFWKEAAAAEATGVRLRATLASIGQQAEADAPKIEKWAEGLMHASDFDDEAIVDGFRNIVVATGDTQEAMFAMEVATNLANQSGQGLERTQQALMMAYNGQTRGLKSLGIVLEEGVVGHEALVAVMERVRGSNESTAASTERSFRRMQVEWGNAKEALGTQFLPIVTAAINKIAEMAEWFNNLTDEQQKSFAQTILWVGAIGGVVAVGAKAAMTILEVRSQIALMTMAQAASNAQGRGMLAWMRGIPPAAYAAVVAILALASAYKELNEMNAVAGQQVDNTSSGGRYATNSGYVATGKDANGNDIYETPRQMMDQGRPNLWESLWSFPFSAFPMFKYAKTQGEMESRTEYSNDYIDRSRRMQNNQMNSEDWAEGERSHFSHSESIRSQTNYRTNFLP